MFKLYRKSQAAQMNWIRQNPVKYITLNVILLAAFIGYLEYQDRRFDREIEDARTQHGI